MDDDSIRILHLEDSPSDALLIANVLRAEFRNFQIVQVEAEETFLKHLRDPNVRIVLSDYSLPGYDGISALAEVQKLRPELPFIFVSGAMGEDMAVECMKIGATDYVLKSNLKRLPAAIRRALNELDTRLTLLEAARVAKVVPWYWNEVGDTWIFGYLVMDILGHAPDILRTEPGFLRAQVHVEDLPRFISAFSRAKDLGRMDLDCRVRHGDGRWLWTRWTLAWTDGRCRGILQDITELRTTQDALIQSQRLESLGTMIGGITHDFGNLILAMSSATELLSLSALPEAQRHYVDILSRSCTRALEFKNDLLRLARKDDAPTRVPSNLNDMVHEAASLLVHTLGRGIEVELEATPGLPEVMAVPAHLLQVLMNLAINARDAMAGQGRLALRTGMTQLSEPLEPHRQGGTYVFVEVEDTGPGIPDEVLAHMFESFFTTKKEGKGTGLGLAMVKAIVQQHDGILQVDTKPGKGARFRILLPALGLEHAGE